MLNKPIVKPDNLKPDKQIVKPEPEPEPIEPKPIVKPEPNPYF